MVRSAPPDLSPGSPILFPVCASGVWAVGEPFLRLFLRPEPLGCRGVCAAPGSQMLRCGPPTLPAPPDILPHHCAGPGIRRRRYWGYEHDIRTVRRAADGAVGPVPSWIDEHAGAPCCCTRRVGVAGAHRSAPWVRCRWWFLTSTNAPSLPSRPTRFRTALGAIPIVTTNRGCAPPPGTVADGDVDQVVSGPTTQRPPRSGCGPATGYPGE